MAKIIKDTGPAKKTIRDIGTSQNKFDPDAVAIALGAEKLDIKIDTRQGPITLFGLRHYLIERLRSTGGRPAVTGTEKQRNKIPLFAEDWDKLKELANYYKEQEHINASPAQIASILLHQSLNQLYINTLTKKSKKI